MTNLTSLELKEFLFPYPDKLYNKFLSNLINLKSLELQGCTIVECTQLTNLTNLENLGMYASLTTRASSGQKIYDINLMTMILS